MKKIRLLIHTFTILFLLIIFSSCVDHDAPVVKNFNVQRIGSCEYLVSRNAYGNVMSHKGDCNNLIHKPQIIVVRDTIYLPLK